MWACALVALLSSWIWTATTPSFQVPDEIVHSGYVHYLGETGRVPRPIATKVGYFDLSQELRVAVEGVPFSYQGVPSWDPRWSEYVQHALDGELPKKHEPEAGSAANNPPLYYVLEAVPYTATRAGDFYDRLLAMRLFSALFAAITAALAFLFVRELLPGTPWAWLVGGLAVAFQPVLGFIAGGVNPDSLLWAASAGVFLAIARILRHGLTRRRALGLGLALSAGLLTKGAMFAMVPGAGLALLIAVRRLPRESRREGLAAASLGIAAGALPFFAWLGARELFWGEEVAGSSITGGVTAAESSSNLREQLGYLWQVYLPRLPFMDDQFPGFAPWEVWFKGFVGRFGYFAFDFADWVEWFALAIAVGVLALAARELWRRRETLRVRRAELATYVVLTLSLMLLLGIAGYQFSEREGIPFEQTRYLFPLLPLYGAVVALAARGAGRFGRYVALGLVALFAAHTVFAVLLSTAHYYG
jgi:4-amino-4-deoxy-L-arabinose transferase-like glycosyltransferase